MRAVAQAYALAYAKALPALTETAKQHGYCLAVHGSMATDLDLLCCPWVETASDPDVLVQALADCINGKIVYASDGKAGLEKPHGRLAYNVLPTSPPDLPRLDYVPWLDISVTPKGN